MLKYLKNICLYGKIKQNIYYYFEMFEKGSVTVEKKHRNSHGVNAI